MNNEKSSRFSCSHKGEQREYYIKTVEEYNEIAEAILNRDCGEWFGKFMPILVHYLKQEPTGGSLHIVIEDGNLEDDHVAWCAGYAYGINDLEGADIAELMRLMDHLQRKEVYIHSGGIL